MYTSEQTRQSTVKLSYRFKGAPETNVWTVYFQHQGYHTARQQMHAYLDALKPFLAWHEVTSLV